MRMVRKGEVGWLHTYLGWVYAVRCSSVNGLMAMIGQSR